MAGSEVGRGGQVEAQPSGRSAEQRLRALVEHVHDVIAVHDAAGRIRYASPAINRLLGLDEDCDLAALRPSELVHPEDLDRVQATFRRWLSEGGGGDDDVVAYRLRHADGSWRQVESLAGAAPGGPETEGLIVTTRDLTERRRAEEELSYQALHDRLTGLPNRALFLDRITQSLSRAARDHSSVAVVVLDLDRFTIINESLGHAAGNEAIRAVADLFDAVVGTGDTLARLTGDEFAVLAEGAGVHQAIGVAQRLQQVLGAPFGLVDVQIHVTASVGIAVSDGTTDAETLLRDGEAAMYRAKARTTTSFEVFDQAMLHQSMSRLQLEGDLRRATELDELRIHFQPEVDLRTGAIVGVEALVRWEHPRFGLMQPEDFIPLAEETGLILVLGRRVLTEACQQAAAWRDAAPEQRIMVSVNLSARQLADRSLVDTVRQAIASNEIEPATLCLEITESVLMDEAETSVRTLRALKALGVRLAVDDFGTGYSSLSYLKRFPVDYLKIDRSFVDGLGRDPEDTAIVSAVVTLAHSLGLEVVAEGVETVHQRDELRRLGASHAQGFFWSEPVPASAVEALLTAQSLGPSEAMDDLGPAPSDAGEVAAIAAAHADGTRNQSFDEAVRALTHELRTPLAIIIGFAETLAQLGPDDEPMRAKAEAAIGRAATGMSALIDSLVAVGALDSGDLRLDLRPTDLGQLAIGVVDDLAGALGDRTVEVAADGPAPVLVDPSRISQVVTNLITNATKFSPEGAPVSVRVVPVGIDVELHVVDQGPGVPPDRLADVFRKFSRLDRTKQGTGLGLYLARGIARAHGGELSCRRAPTGGADFVLTLSLYDEAAEARV